MSFLSFNVSLSNGKEFLKDLTESVQIMPQTLKIPTNDFIESFPKSEVKKESIIHTSYITIPFLNIENEDKFKRAKYNLVQYCKLCKRIGFHYLLVHLPRNENELSNLGNGMYILRSMCNAYEFIELVLEIPYISCINKEHTFEYIINYFKNIVQYFEKFKNRNVSLCFDTAHLYSNGLDSEDMIRLFEYKINDKRLIDYCKIIHFNGNERSKYTSDKHVAIFSKKNKFTETEKLIDYLVKANKILIAENTSNFDTYENWKEFAEKHDLRIVKSIPELGT